MECEVINERDLKLVAKFLRLTKHLTNERQENNSRLRLGLTFELMAY